MKVLEKIESVCPTCFQSGSINKLSGSIVEEDGDVFLTKTCDKHGFFKDLYFGDIRLYDKWMKFKVTGNPVSNVKTSLFDDPALYPEHLSQTVLTNIVITNRYNEPYKESQIQSDKNDFEYEPSIKDIKFLMQQARDQKPIGCNSIQIMGGEPTLRGDIFDIVRSAKNMGFSHVQIRTDGLRIAEDEKFCKCLKDEKVDSIYLIFNGVTSKSNPFFVQNKKAIENLRNVNLEVVLEPIIYGEKNLNESGKIVHFAIDNMDIVKGINFRPVTFFADSLEFDDDLKNNQRVSYSQILKVVEDEFKGQISYDDFYPMSFVFPFTKIIEILKNEMQLEITAHPGCGGSCFVFIEDGKIVPLTRFMDVEGFLEFLIKQQKKGGPLRKLRVAATFYKHIERLIDYDIQPKGFDIKQIFKESAIGGSDYALRNFRNKSFFIGFSCFQDLFNLNVDCLKRCIVHYSTFEGIVPSCLYNCFGYDRKICKKYSNSANR